MADFSADMSRSRWDPVFFSRRFLGIKLHPGQVRFIRAVAARGPEGWRSGYYTICLSAGNRAGKTLALAVAIIWSCMFKVGQPPPESVEDADMQKRRKHPYMWYHMAIQQEIAELVYTEIINIFSGTHVAQHGDGCPLAAEIVEAGGGPIADWSRKYNGDYRWVVFSSLFGGAEIHFRTTAEKGIGSLGRDMHGVSFDECGLERNLLWIVNNVLHLRRLGTGGQMLLISTPEEGLTEFADLWEAGNPEAPDRQKGKMSLRMSTRDNIGFGLERHVFDQLIADMDPAIIDQNIEGKFIQGRLAYFNAAAVNSCFRELPEYQRAQNRHTYVQGIDPSLTYDSTWSIVGDVIAGKDGENMVVCVRADRTRGKQTVDGLVALAADAHDAYDKTGDGFRSYCATAIDATGFGGKMFKDLLEKEIGQIRTIEFGGNLQRKRKLLGDLKTMIDSGRLLFPKEGKLWLALRRQLLGYKQQDRAIEQDGVMALACLVAEVRRTRPVAEDASGFDFYATEQSKIKKPFSWRAPRITEDMLRLG